MTGRAPGAAAPGPLLDWRRATVLGAAEFDVARDLLDLGRGPAVLGVLSPGPTDVERAGVVRAATRSLAARGLLGAGGFRSALVDDLRTVVAPEFQHDLVVSPPTAQQALVGYRSGRAVLATRIGDDVALLRVPPEQAAAALVELLGPLARGPGPTVRIPARVLAGAAAAAGDRTRWVAELLRRGCSGAEAELVARMGDLRGLAQLGAGRSGPGGRRAPAVLLVHVTAQGCYYQRRPTPAVIGGPPPDGATVQAGPADAATLVAELTALTARTPPG
ncbi:ESX secretion-associated protein EspG [Pseudonocardia sp. NPDC046786]|uniref:ESX secretion-associated protein EspG n=1 Tax=Pseudonocardia sp. NPDC046786 TaxID=3155471 RepID=UPI0033CECC2D